MLIHVKSQRNISNRWLQIKKFLQQLCTTFIQLNWLEHTTKSHWVCSSRTQYKIIVQGKAGKSFLKFWRVKTSIVWTYVRNNKHLLSTNFDLETIKWQNLYWQHWKSLVNIIDQCSWPVGLLTKVECLTTCLDEKKMLFVSHFWLAHQHLTREYGSKMDKYVKNVS